MMAWFRNSLIVATITTVLTLVTNILAAYPLAQHALPRPQDRAADHPVDISAARRDSAGAALPGHDQIQAGQHLFQYRRARLRQRIRRLLDDAILPDYPGGIGRSRSTGWLQPLRSALAPLHPAEQAGHRHGRYLHLRPQLERLLSGRSSSATRTPPAPCRSAWRSSLDGGYPCALA